MEPLRFAIGRPGVKPLDRASSGLGVVSSFAVSFLFNCFGGGDYCF